MNLPTENQNPFMRNIMEQVVSNVISMEEVKNKKLEAQLSQSLENLIESGMDEAQARRILGIDS